MNKNINSWDETLDRGLVNPDKSYDLNDIYDHAHSELSLQQSKRDQIITIYLALCSFLIPLALGQEVISFRFKGLIFLIVGIVGVLFSLVTVRYREYKEVYWLSCQSITVMQSINPEKINKSVIQRAFYHCIRKKGNGYLYTANGDTKLKKLLFVKKNIFSSETLHFVIIALMTSFISGLGAGLLLKLPNTAVIAIGAFVALLIMIFLLITYFRTCIKVYACLEKRDDAYDVQRRDKAFNKVFSKAWFLHFYFED